MGILFAAALPARVVVSSPWRERDESAAELMRRFYAHSGSAARTPRRRYAALQLELLREGRARAALRTFVVSW